MWSRAVARRFTREVVEGAKKLRVGDPMDWDTEVGPMVSMDQFELVRELVDDAVANGATLALRRPGGRRPAYYEPAVLTGVTHDMRIMREEIFGPVVPIVEVADEEEAIRLANDCEFGLGTSVWTLDRDKGRRIARRIETGMVWINDHMYSHGAIQTPWGGVKHSGLGRSHSRIGFEECVNVKHVAWEPSRLRAVLVAPVRRVDGQGAPLLRAAPVRPRRGQGGRAEAGCAAAREGRPQGAPRRLPQLAGSLARAVGGGW